MSPTPRLVSSSLRPPRFLRFGPFELDVRAGELRKHGTRLRLRTQTLQILLILLEHAGEVVLREEIRQQLWPKDTTVEFDHGINAAIQKLRDALGESADKPRYIETLPRRGYRFLGEVAPVEEEPIPAVREPGPALVIHSAASAQLTSGEPESRSWLSKVKIATAIVVAGLVGLLIGLLIWLRPFSGRTFDSGQRRNFTLSLGASAPFATVSPDGTSVAYPIPGAIAVRRLDSLTEFHLDDPNFGRGSPIWSPDSSEVAYVNSKSLLIRRQVSKGLSTTVCRLPLLQRGLTWSSQGVVMFAFVDKDEGSLNIVPASGGSPVRVEVPTLPHGLFFAPEFLPNGEDFLFAFAGEGDEEAGLYLATLRNGKVTRGPILLRKNVTGGHYSPAGGAHLLYVRDDNLLAQELDTGSGKLKGEPRQIVEGVFSREHVRMAQFSVSRNGVLIWRPGKGAQSQLTWFDRKGNILGTAGAPAAISSFSLSPDEKHLLVTMAERRSGLVEPYQSSVLPLPGISRRPLWMPDSAHILYCRWEPERCRLMVREAAGGQETEIARLPEMAYLRSVSPDGSFVLYYLNSGIHAARIAGRSEKHLPEIALSSSYADFSPDGRWIVYNAYDRDKRLLVFIEPFGSAGIPTQISPEGGGHPIWRGDGKEVLYLHGRTEGGQVTVYSVRVETKGNEIHVTPPEALFKVRISDAIVLGGKPLGVTRDGSRILVARSMDEPDSHINVMTAWDELLKH
jgi:DNA-binding winged helix-turn-helix (wHTH) protein